MFPTTLFDNGYALEERALLRMLTFLEGISVNRQPVQMKGMMNDDLNGLFKRCITIRMK